MFVCSGAMQLAKSNPGGSYRLGSTSVANHRLALSAVIELS